MIPAIPKRPIPWAALAAVALAACGGADETPRARADAAPALATLASEGSGVRELRAGDLAGARAVFESLLGADPDRVAALNDLAVSYYLDGRFEAARQLLDEAVARGDAAVQQAALVNLGELYAVEGYLSAAQAHFESARGIDPARPGPLYALAVLASARGDGPGALALVRAALALDETGSGRRALAFVYEEERIHLAALVDDARGDRRAALGRWRALRAGRFPLLAAAAERRLEAESR